MTVPHKYGLQFSEEEFLLDIEEFLKDRNITHPDATAIMIKKILNSGSILGRLLNYNLDICSDYLIADEYYKSQPSLMLFLARAGASHDELCFRAYHHTHDAIFTCKKCGNPLVGGCPLVECSNCNKVYYMDIAGISSDMCKNCVSGKLGTCSEIDRTRTFKIYGL